MIVEELINQALLLDLGRKVKDVRAGLGYTCIMLEDESCGLAYTFKNELGNCCGVLQAAGSLIGMEASQLIPWAKEENRLKAAIGLATINAIVNDSKQCWATGNVLNALTLNQTDTFGMVGEFRPILSKVKSMTDQIYVFERNITKKGELYTEEEMPLYLTKCDVVVITATSIINHTIDQVISYCKNAREVCLVGPSTPLCADIFKKYNITLLAGSVVKEPESILQIVSQAGGTMAMKSALDQVLVKI